MKPVRLALALLLLLTLVPAGFAGPEPSQILGVDLTGLVPDPDGPQDFLCPAGMVQRIGWFTPGETDRYTVVAWAFGGVVFAVRDARTDIVFFLQPPGSESLQIPLADITPESPYAGVCASLDTLMPIIEANQGETKT